MNASMKEATHRGRKGIEVTLFITDAELVVHQDWAIRRRIWHAFQPFISKRRKALS